MNLRIFRKRNPGAELAMLHAEQCRNRRQAERRRLLARTAQMRREIGLPEDPRLGA